MIDPVSLSLFVWLFMLSAFFSGTELALMSLASHKIESLVKQWKAWAKALKQIKEKNDKLLITILIWNNLINVYTASLATTISIDIAEKSGLEQSVAIWISTWVITLLLLLFGEIAPKTFATKNAEKISLFVARPYQILMFILTPITFIIEGITRLLTWKNNEAMLSNEDIEAFIDMGKDSGTLELSEHEKIKSVLEFSDRTVEEIMTPRVKVDALEKSTTVDDAIIYALKHTHSRLPVYDKSIDKINYFLHTRNLLREKINNNWHKTLDEIELPKVMKVPLNQPIDTLLESFQKAYKQLAVVIDEYGGVAGIVTMEDIIEEVFGDIKDETDKKIEEVKKVWNSNYVIQSHVLINEILDLFELDFKDIWLDEREIWWETISYVITQVLERFPSPWEKINFKIFSDEDEEQKSLAIKVQDISNFQIDKVEVHIKKES